MSKEAPVKLHRKEIKGQSSHPIDIGPVKGFELQKPRGKGETVFSVLKPASLPDLSVSSVRTDRRIVNATIYDQCKETRTELPCCYSITANACPCR